jgi:uncharacterized protein YbaR (Trm112 family)
MDHKVISLLQCPDCSRGVLTLSPAQGELVCECCKQRFPFSQGRPVLLRHDNELFRIEDYLRVSSDATVQGNGKWSRIVPSPSVNLSSTRILQRLGSELNGMGRGVVLVVGGGKQRRWLDTVLNVGQSVRVVYTDIDVDADIDLFCDAHALPFRNASFDAVVTTAVLEHVMYPERAAAEIVRVMKVGGWLYSELPFMQQVHEGAYDFTRYTLSGHRRLFNSFDVLDSGMVAGPGTALAWAVENFFLAFASRSATRSLVKVGARVLFGWIKYFDYVLAKRPEAMDGASCTYLLGRKVEGQISDADIVAGYVGAKHVRHT